MVAGALELSRSDGTTARARLSDDTVGGTPLSGLVATVDATKNGSPDSRVTAPAPRVLSDQIGTAVWYSVHVGAIFDATEARFSFDVTADSLSAHLDSIALPFDRITGVIVSCGVDNAVGGTSNGTYQILVDDVSVSACAR